MDLAFTAPTTDNYKYSIQLHDETARSRLFDIYHREPTSHEPTLRDLGEHPIPGDNSNERKGRKWQAGYAPRMATTATVHSHGPPSNHTLTETGTKKNTDQPHDCDHQLFMKIRFISESLDHDFDRVTIRNLQSCTDDNTRCREWKEKTNFELGMDFDLDSPRFPRKLKPNVVKEYVKGVQVDLYKGDKLVRTPEVLQTKVTAYSVIWSGEPETTITRGWDSGVGEDTVCERGTPA